MSLFVKNLWNFVLCVPHVLLISFSLVSAALVYLGLLFISLFVIFMLQRSTHFNFGFLEAHGLFDFTIYGAKFLLLGLFLLILTWLLQLVFKVNIEKGIANTGILCFLLVGLPMQLNLEAIRGMMWQLTDPTIMKPNVLFLIVILLVLLGIVNFFYSHTSILSLRGAYAKFIK